MEIIPDVLVHQKVFGRTQKIEDQWKAPVHKVLEQCVEGPELKVISADHKTIRMLEYGVSICKLIGGCQ